MSTAKAQKRLQLAFDRLEAAARRVKDRDHGGAAASAALEQVRAELDETRRNYGELERKAAGATERIDAAVVRLKAVLADGGD